MLRELNAHYVPGTGLQEHRLHNQDAQSSDVCQQIHFKSTLQSQARHSYPSQSVQSPLCSVNHSHQCDDHSSNQTIVQSQEQGGNKSGKPDGLNKRQKALCRILLKFSGGYTHTYGT